MPEWEPRTLRELTRYVLKEQGRSQRRSSQTINRADEAQETADGAVTLANGALASANGKNTIRFRIAAPTTSADDAGTADGDIWFVIPNVQTGIVTGQYTWMAATQSWIQQTLSSAVLASIDAGKITTGTLVGITITGVTITGSVVTGGTVQTSPTGKRVVLANNAINFYGISGSTAVNAGLIEGVPNGASGGLISIASGSGGSADIFAQFGFQALPTSGSASMRSYGVAWFDDIYAGGGTVTGRMIRTVSTSDVSPTSTLHGLEITASDGSNLRMDNNEIMAVTGAGGANSLYIQGDGGNVGLGNSASTVSIPGVINNPRIPSNIASGRTSYNSSVAAGGNASVSVTFPSSRFSAAPVVTASTENGRFNATPQGISASGMTISLTNVTSGSGTPGTVHWQAMDAG